MSALTRRWSVEAELVALGIGHHDVSAGHRRRGFVTVEPAATESDETLALLLEGHHPFVTRESGCGPDIEVHTILRGLSLGNTLKEDARSAAVGVD